MKFILGVLIFAFCVSSFQAEKLTPHQKSSAAREDVKAENFVTIGDKEYYIPPDNLSYWMNVLDAMKFCRDLNMTLLSLETPEENQLVREYLSGLDGRGTDPFWTTGHKMMASWMWSGVAEEISFFDWEDGEPSDVTSKDICVQMFADRGWSDTDCYYSRVVMCERNC